jgi:hypothetical protein
MQTQVDIFTEATGGPMTNPVQRMRSSFIHLPVSGDYFPKMRIHLIETLLNLSIDFPLIDEIVRLLRPIRYSSARIVLDGDRRNGIGAWQYTAMIDRTQRRTLSSDA